MGTAILLMEFRDMKKFDLEKRTENFAIAVRVFIKKLSVLPVLSSDLGQLVRSSGSVGANFIEATEKLGDKDLKFRLKIALKEAKESLYWLNIIKKVYGLDGEVDELISEAIELKHILAAILKKMR